MKITLISGMVVAALVAVISVSWFDEGFEKDAALTDTDTTAVTDLTGRDSDVMRYSAPTDAVDVSESTTLSPPITLLGVTYSQKPKQSLALIRFQQSINSYRVAQFIDDSDVYIEYIEKNKIVVRYNDRLFDVMITREEHDLHSDVSEQFGNKPQTTSRQTADSDIGNRPKSLSHIVTLPDQRSDNATGVMPGLNPALFKSAGFQPGDELLAVNGNDVRLEEFLDTINKEIQTAHTLTFDVLRNGRRVTLYLDIPSESLKVR